MTHPFLLTSKNGNHTTICEMGEREISYNEGITKIKIIMTFEEFKSSFKKNIPPAECSDYLKSLWHDGKGDWDASHNIAQDIPNKNGDWIHAYLHRKEGDQWNAGYWYRRAGKPMPDYSLEKEWEELVRHFL